MSNEQFLSDYAGRKILLPSRDEDENANN